MMTEDRKLIVHVLKDRFAMYEAMREALVEASKEPGDMASDIAREKNAVAKELEAIIGTLMTRDDADVFQYQRDRANDAITNG